MKRIYFLLAFTIIAFSSCSVYKNSQTPDDVYYSPGVQRDGYSAAKNSDPTDESGEYYTTSNDRYVRMKVQDPARWSYFDDYGYDNYTPYSPYSAFGYSGIGLGIGLGSGFYSGFGYGSPWIGGYGYYSPLSYYYSYSAWNSYYNPYYGGVILVSPKVPASRIYSTLRPFSAGSYNNNNVRGNSINRYNTTRGNGYSPYSQQQTRSNSSGLGNTLRRTFGGNNNSGSQPVRTYSPSSSGSSGSFGGGGGGGGSVSRPVRR